MAVIWLFRSIVVHPLLHLLFSRILLNLKSIQHRKHLPGNASFSSNLCLCVLQHRKNQFDCPMQSWNMNEDWNARRNCYWEKWTYSSLNDIERPVHALSAESPEAVLSKISLVIELTSSLHILYRLPSRVGIGCEYVETRERFDVRVEGDPERSLYSKIWWPSWRIVEYCSDCVKTHAVQ